MCCGKFFSNRESGTKFPTEVLRYSNFLTAQYREKSYLPKFSSVYSAISTKHGLMTDTLMDTQPQHTCILYQQPSITPHMLILVTSNSEKKTAPILCYIKYDKYHYHNEGHK